jgi:hypothetical protein
MIVNKKTGLGPRRPCCIAHDFSEGIIRLNVVVTKGSDRLHHRCDIHRVLLYNRSIESAPLLLQTSVAVAKRRWRTRNMSLAFRRSA